MDGRNHDGLPALHVFQQITVGLSMDYLQKGEPLPNSFEEIPFVARLAEKPMYTELVNHLAIVPKSPVIPMVPGVLRSREGFRLFAIARQPDLELEKLGRRVILITADGGSAFTSWIVETEAQIILSQLNGFDPEKQPLAFQTLISKKGQRLPDQNVRDSSQTAPSDDNAIATAPPHRKPVTPAAGSALTENLTSWLAVLVGLVVILLGYLGVRYFRKKA